MPVLSKFFGSQLGLKVLTTNCYETCHTWEPDCSLAIQACLDLGELVRAKGDPRKLRFRKLLLSILQSSCFLTTNLVAYLFFMCRIRHLLGFWVWPTLGLTNGILSSFTAILIEKASRRPALALYLTNLASETFFRQAVNHGYISYIPNGQWIGIEEHSVLPKWIWARFPETWKATFKGLRGYPKADTCLHPHSCVSSVVEPSIRNFLIGFAASSLLTVFKNFGVLRKSPLKLLPLLVAKSNLRIPGFLASLPFLYNTTSCLIEHQVPNFKWKPAIAGLVSGAGMRLFPNVTIAMYMFWKAIEHLYDDLVARGYIPKFRHGAIMLYTFATGYVLFVAAIEPHALRTGYYKFLMGLSGNRLAVFNRRLFDEVGFRSSKMFPNWRPRLNAAYLTQNPELYLGPR
ncbi:unnamed protein product, partial [Mesorhabditis spiculigera]